MVGVRYMGENNIIAHVVVTKLYLKNVVGTYVKSVFGKMPLFSLRIQIMKEELT
jgi:hypothetical protein